MANVSSERVQKKRIVPTPISSLDRTAGVDHTIRERRRSQMENDLSDCTFEMRGHQNFLKVVDTLEERYRSSVSVKELQALENAELLEAELEAIRQRLERERAERIRLRAAGLVRETKVIIESEDDVDSDSEGDTASNDYDKEEEEEAHNFVTDEELHALERDLELPVSCDTIGIEDRVESEQLSVDKALSNPSDNSLLQSTPAASTTTNTDQPPPVSAESTQSSIFTNNLHPVLLPSTTQPSSNTNSSQFHSMTKSPPLDHITNPSFRQHIASAVDDSIHPTQLPPRTIDRRTGDMISPLSQETSEDHREDKEEEDDDGGRGVYMATAFTLAIRSEGTSQPSAFVEKTLGCLDKLCAISQKKRKVQSDVLMDITQQATALSQTLRMRSSTSPPHGNGLPVVEECGRMWVALVIAIRSALRRESNGNISKTNREVLRKNSWKMVKLVQQACSAPNVITDKPLRRAIKRVLEEARQWFACRKVATATVE